MAEVWRRYNGYFHIIIWSVTVAFTGGTIWQTVYAYGPRLASIEAKQLATEEKQAVSDRSLARIEQSVEDIKLYLHVPDRNHR